MFISFVYYFCHNQQQSVMLQCQHPSGTPRRTPGVYCRCWCGGRYPPGQKNPSVPGQCVCIKRLPVSLSSLGCHISPPSSGSILLALPTLSYWLCHSWAQDRVMQWVLVLHAAHKKGSVSTILFISLSFLHSPGKLSHVYLVSIR